MRPSRGPIALLVACFGIAWGLWMAARRLDVVEVRGPSMVPTLLPGDRLIVARLRRPPRIGEVVLLRDPREPGRELVKRVIDTEAGGLRVRGDNPDFSTDTRVFGPIPVTEARWRVLARTWPIGRLGRIGRPAALDSALVPVDEGGEPACAVPQALVVGGS